jgi:ligand-binding sensor domain-containing protein/signal transduction histidine kinase
MPRPLLLARLTVSGMFLAAPHLAAQQADGLDPRKAMTQYVHDVWQTENGLPQNSVLDVLQTRDGYLWLGTRGGLVRFDGVRFTAFDKENTPALGDNDIRALLEDREGSLWIGTYSGGLSRLKDGKFTTYTTEHGLAHDQVRALYEDREGSLWIGTYGGGLSRLKDGKFTTYTTKDGLADDKVRPILQDREGSLWIGTYGGGLSRLKDGKFTTYTTRDGLPSNIVFALLEDHDGGLWIGTYGGGLSWLKDGKFTTYTTRDGLADDRINSLYQDRLGTLWIGTYGGGLSRLTGEGFSTFSTRNGLSDDMVFPIYRDVEGSLWIGTYGGGLNRLKDGTFTTYGTKEGLSSSIVYSIYEDADGPIWLGTEGGGLNRLKDGKVTAYTTRDGLSSDNVVSVYRDREGSLWAGTFGGGLNRLQGGRFTAFHMNDGLASEQVFALYGDREGNLWIGTSDVLNRYRDGKFTTYGSGEGLVGTGVRAIHQDRTGALWVGTGEGLHRLENGRFTRKGLEGKMVLAIHEDRDGTLWIATRANGLARLRNGKLTTFSTKEGLPDDAIFSILEDHAGNLWMSSAKGIFRVSRHALNAVAEGRSRSLGAVLYGKGDGIRGSEGVGGSQPVAWKTRDGRLWFSSHKGASVVDPARLQRNERIPPVVLEQVVVNGRPVSGAGEIALPAGSRNLEFHYTALSLLAPEKVRFRYRLEGFDDGWVDAGTRRAAYYTNLPPGRYRFRVIASNNDGVWNRAGAAFAFRLQPHFYQTYWFYGLLGLAAVLLAVALFRLKTRHLEARQSELARLVEERTEELRRSQQQLLVSEKMAALGRLTAGIAHEINSPLGGVLNSLQLARLYVDEYGASLDDREVTAADHRAIADDLAASLTLAEKGTRKVAQFVRSIKAQTRMEGEGQRRDFDPAEELDPTLALMRHELTDRRVALHVESRPGLRLTGDAGKFGLVVRNLVSNAVDSYEGKEGEVWIRLTENGHPGGVRLEVEDRGCGIPEEIRSRVFDYLFTTKDVGSGTGLGLSIVHSVVTSEFGGEISVRSEVGRGTTVSVCFPPPAADAQPGPAPGASAG